MSESGDTPQPQLPPGWPKDVFPPPPDADLGPTEAQKHAELDHGECCSCSDCRSARSVRRIAAATEAESEKEFSDLQEEQRRKAERLRNEGDPVQIVKVEWPPPGHREFCSCSECAAAREARVSAAFPKPPDAEDGEAVFGNMVEGERHAAPMLREGALDGAEGATCTCDPGGKLCATCARGETDPGMVPFEDLPEETRRALKPGQCIVWDAERHRYVPVPVHVQAAAGGEPLTPLKSSWLGEEEIIPEIRPEDRLHTATDGEKQPFLTSDEIRQRLERLEYPQVARDLQERAFLVLLGDEGGKKWPDHPEERRRYFRNLWTLAAEAVEAQP